jgi:hypothetical protein
MQRQQGLARYGLTLEAYDRLLQLQDGRCAICGKTDNGNARCEPLFIDHNHQTGQVRGLLCSRCNHAIGLFHEDLDALGAAIQYLSRHQPTDLS